MHAIFNNKLDFDSTHCLRFLTAVKNCRNLNRSVYFTMKSKINFCNELSSSNYFWKLCFRLDGILFTFFHRQQKSLFVFFTAYVYVIKILDVNWTPLLKCKLFRLNFQSNLKNLRTMAVGTETSAVQSWTAQQLVC